MPVFHVKAYPSPWILIEVVDDDDDVSNDNDDGGEDEDHNACRNILIDKCGSSVIRKAKNIFSENSFKFYKFLKLP